MFEPQDLGEAPIMRLAVGVIMLILGLMAFQLDAIYKTLKAQPKEFIQQFDDYRETELNP